MFDLDLEPVASSGAITATEWTPASALRRGRTYLWQVQATTAAGSETVPSPPAPEARFHVASASAVTTVEPAVTTGSDLAAGVALAEAGFLEEAAQRFDALAAANPGSREAQRLRAALARPGSADPSHQLNGLFAEPAVLGGDAERARGNRLGDAATRRRPRGRARAAPPAARRRRRPFRTPRRERAASRQTRPAHAAARLPFARHGRADAVAPADVTGAPPRTVLH